MITLYTLKTCDTCKKAIKWLDEHAIAYENRDVRTDGLARETIARIVATMGWDKAMNRRSTTWRNLSDAEKTGIDDQKAIDLIEANPTLMKRPVFMIADDIHAGFDEEVRKKLKA